MNITTHSTMSANFIKASKYNAASNAMPATSLKDPASTITHFIGMLLSILAMPFLLHKASLHTESQYFLSSAVFMISMILLYMASSCYHAIRANEKITKLLQKFDHMMIYVLIAGSYTPICLLVLSGRQGIILFYIVWGTAIAGLLLSALWINSPKWLNSVIYIAMGWLCLLQFPKIIAEMSRPAFLWLLIGGIIYTIGGVIYALKLPVFNKIHPGFGSHEIFHMFVLAGSFCHFIMLYCFLL